MFLVDFAEFCFMALLPPSLLLRHETCHGPLEAHAPYFGLETRQ